MAEENVVRKRTREEDGGGVPSDAKRVNAGPDVGLMAFLDGIESMYENEDHQNVVANVKELSSASLENDNFFNFNDVFMDVAEELEMSYFHLCDEEGGLVAVYSTHHGFEPDYTEVNDLCHGGWSLWEDDIWQLKEGDDEIFRCA